MGAITTYVYTIYLVFVWNFSKYPGDYWRSNQNLQVIFWLPFRTCVLRK